MVKNKEEENRRRKKKGRRRRRRHGEELEEETKGKLDEGEGKGRREIEGELAVEGRGRE